MHTAHLQHGIAHVQVLKTARGTIPGRAPRSRFSLRSRVRRRRRSNTHGGTRPVSSVPTARRCSRCGARAEHTSGVRMALKSICRRPPQPVKSSDTTRLAVDARPATRLVPLTEPAAISARRAKPLVRASIPRSSSARRCVCACVCLGAAVTCAGIGSAVICTRPHVRAHAMESSACARFPRKLARTSCTYAHVAIGNVPTRRPSAHRCSI